MEAVIIAVGAVLFAVVAAFGCALVSTDIEMKRLENGRRLRQSGILKD